MRKHTEGYYRKLYGSKLFTITFRYPKFFIRKPYENLIKSIVYLIIIMLAIINPMYGLSATIIQANLYIYLENHKSK